MSQSTMLGRIPPDVVCLTDYERHAQALLEPGPTGACGRACCSPCKVRTAGLRRRA